MKKKLAQKLHSIKVDGLTKRWLLNILLVVVVLLIAAFVAASVFIKNYYYESVRNILESGASANSAEYFSANLDSGMSLETSAAQFIDSYSYKDKTTVWVINNDGEVIASSNGFIIENCEMPDYTSAMSGSDGTGEYTGRITDGGDKIMALIARAMHESGDLRGDGFVATVMSNIGLHNYAKEHGYKVLCANVGDKNVKEMMVKADMGLGGEQSGHIIFRDHMPTGDGQLTALHFLSIISKYGTPVSSLVGEIKRYPQVLINVPVTDEGKKKYNNDEYIISAVQEAEMELHGDGRVLVRVSGTEPLVRVMLEGMDTEQITRLGNDIANVVKERLS